MNSNDSKAGSANAMLPAAADSKGLFSLLAEYGGSIISRLINHIEATGGNDR